MQLICRSFLLPFLVHLWNRWQAELHLTSNFLLSRVFYPPLFPYVWGAPGTGKTHYVLANCVLAYLREDKKIIFVAFTNNALEQMLSGVLEVLFSENISPSCIRRLSIPSNGFVSRYPDICKHQPTEARRSYLTRQIEDLQSKLTAEKNCRATELALSAFSFQKVLTSS